MKERDMEFAERCLERAGWICKDLLKTQLERIASAIEILFEAWQKRRWVFAIGNGGSASTASHLVGDLVKTIVDRPGDLGIKALGLVDNPALISASTNDWGWDRIYDGQLATYWEPESVVVAISVNGGAGKDQAGVYSQNLVRALKFAKESGGRAIGLVGSRYQGGLFKDICDICIIVPDGSAFNVEPFHVLLNHLIVSCLKEKIQQHNSAQGV